MRTTNFITSIKKSNKEKISFIILGANYEYKQKHLGPRCLFKYNNQLMIHHQVEYIKRIYQESEIILVTGFEGNKVFKNKTNFRIVENTTYFDSGEFEQLRLAIQNVETDNVFVVTDTTIHLDLPVDNKSKIFLSPLAEQNPGCTFSKYAENISFGIPNFITKSFFFTRDELDMLKKYLADNKEKKYKCFIYEVVNDLIEKGAQFKAEEVLYENFVLPR